MSRPRWSRTAALPRDVLDAPGLRGLPGPARRSDGRRWVHLGQAQLARSPDLVDWLSAQLVEIATAELPLAQPEYVDRLLGPAGLLRRTGVVALVDPKGGTVDGGVAYETGEFGGARCFYAAAAFLRRELQNAGSVSDVYTALLRREALRHPHRLLHVVVRTANPVVLSSWLRGAQATGCDVHPQPGKRVPHDVAAVARSVLAAAAPAGRLDARTLVVRDALHELLSPGASALYCDPPRAWDDELQSWWDAHVGPEDMVVSVVRGRLPQAAALVANRRVRWLVRGVRQRASR